MTPIDPVRQCPARYATGNRPLQALRLDLRAGWLLARNSLQQRLVYGAELATGLFSTFVVVLALCYLWTALYHYNALEEYRGVPLDMALTYVSLQAVLSQMFPSVLIWEMGARLRSGNILFDLSRPLPLRFLLFYQFLGQTAATFLTISLPALALIFLLLPVRLPVSAGIWLAFALALGLGLALHFLIDYLFALLGFWVTEMNGIYWAKTVSLALLSGRLPLWIFPPFWEQALLLLPFSRVYYTPLMILLGRIPPDQLPGEFAIQAGWVVALILLSRLVFAAAFRKLAIQGG